MNIDTLLALYDATALFLFLLALPGSIALLRYTIHGITPPFRYIYAGKKRTLKLAVVIPAHNEADNIHQTITSLHQCVGHDSNVTIHVVADNCTDETGLISLQLGCKVLERNDSKKRGKGYALAYAFEQLDKYEYDGYIIVDADTIVEPNFIAEMENPLHGDADGAQCRYQVDGDQEGLRPRLMDVAFMLFNVLRPRARARMGASVGIMGNGFALSRAGLKKVPYNSRSIVEDLEHHIDMVRKGLFVHYVNTTTVRSAMPTNRGDAAPQRARWEGGRIGLMFSHAPLLLIDLLRGRTRCLEPFLELTTLPLSYHLLLILPSLVASTQWVSLAGAIGFAIVLAYIAAGLIVGGADKEHLVALASAPAYVLWKLTIGAQIAGASRSKTHWQRTARNTDQEDRPNTQPRSASAHTAAPKPSDRPEPIRMGPSNTRWEEEHTEVLDSMSDEATDVMSNEPTDVLDAMGNESTEVLDQMHNEVTEVHATEVKPKVSANEEIDIPILDESTDAWDFNPPRPPKS